MEFNTVGLVTTGIRYQISTTRWLFHRSAASDLPLLSRKNTLSVPTLSPTYIMEGLPIDARMEAKLRAAITIEHVVRLTLHLIAADRPRKSLTPRATAVRRLRSSLSRPTLQRR